MLSSFLMQNLKKGTRTKANHLLRRKVRINAKIKATAPDFRVFVERSNMYVKAQVINTTGHIVAHITDKWLKGKTKVERAGLAGQQLAELMKKQSITSAAFDRNGYLYHGRIQAFADGLRQGGIHI